MIRIDEIYCNTFWAWIEKHRPGMRMFTFSPFGRTDPDSIISYTNGYPMGEVNDVTVKYYKQNSSVLDSNYTIFLDQEPIDLVRQEPTFKQLKNVLNADINWPYLLTDQPIPQTGIIVTSEKDSDTVDELCRQYGWKSLYYFFHGWAALDWYRGYDRTYLMPEPNERKITRTFIMPNRIIGGERRHRLIMLYHIFRAGMTNNHISCPAQCPAENIDIDTAVKDLVGMYPDIREVFKAQQFPIKFAGETQAPMHSYQLSLFQESAESLLYLVTETVAEGRRLHLTEKTFKPICLRMPFMIVGTRGSLAYLRSYGFKTFNHLWDESYDEEINDLQRYEKIAWTLRALNVLPAQEKQRLFDLAQEVCEYNYRHFYNGGFEQLLWTELQETLSEI